MIKKMIFIGLIGSSLIAEYKDISLEELEELRKSGVPVVDVRTAGEWRDTGVVPGSVMVTSHSVDRKLDMDKFEIGLRGSDITKASEFILICRSGNRTSEVSKLLEERGFVKFYNVKNGIKEWIREKKPMEDVY